MVDDHLELVRLQLLAQLAAARPLLEHSTDPGWVELIDAGSKAVTAHDHQPMVRLLRGLFGMGSLSDPGSSGLPREDEVELTYVLIGAADRLSYLLQNGPLPRA